MRKNSISTARDIKMPWDGPIHLTTTLAGKRVLRGSEEAAQDIMDRHELSKAHHG